MNIRPIEPRDLDNLYDVDGTIESARYLHVEQSGEGFSVGWRLEDRQLREKKSDANRMDDERQFLARQIVIGADEGLATMVGMDQVPMAFLLAQPDPGREVLTIVDLRVDYEHRRQGLGTALMYQAITEARNRAFRAVAASCQTDNHPAASFLAKLGFELAGLDTRRQTNHDLVKEAVTLYWYLPLN